MARDSGQGIDPSAFLRADGTFDETAYINGCLHRPPATSESDDVLLARLPSVLRDVLTRDSFTVDGHTHRQIDSGPYLGRHFQLKSVELSADDRVVAVIFGWDTQPGRLFGMWWDLSDLDHEVWWAERTAEGISESILTDMDEDISTRLLNNTGNPSVGPEVNGVCWVGTPAPFGEGANQSWRLRRST